MFAGLLTVEQHACVMVVPYMASIIAKQKANQLYYYVVESARVQGKPRIVQQTYLGTAEGVAALVKDRAAPERTSSPEARSPNSSDRASTTSDLPLPVSPVSRFKPRWKRTRTRSITA